MLSNILETEIAIKLVKDTFEIKLAKNLELVRVSAPLIVRNDSGLNDDLNGVERPVSFDILETKVEASIVHSLAKWKRLALKRYNFPNHKGLYTDMNAIRRDETTDELHSIYVDQWDWERTILHHERTIETLKNNVKAIYKSILQTQRKVCNRYKNIINYFPKEVFFITSQELLDMYPTLTSKEREYQITKEKKAVFIIGIGNKLSNNEVHDNRAPDYDDWMLNGDLLVYYPPLDLAIELSSMGIRVTEESLVTQLKEKNCLHRLEYPFHKALLNKELPYTIGGGIGQSRLCLIMLNKRHIGEVQASIWPDEMIEKYQKNNVEFL